MLSDLAGYLRDRVRDSDVIARFGGEEFCLVASNITKEDALVFFQTLCNEVAELRVSWGDTEISLTISIGVSTKQNGLDEMIEAADTQLYQAKEQGRNQVVIV